MTLRFLVALMCLLAIGLFITAGCSGPPANPPAGAENNPGSEMPAANDDVQANLAKLSPELQELAAKQQTCPISKQPLGSMGVPEKVTVNGQDVLVCCDHCTPELKKNPEKYLTKSEE